MARWFLRAYLSEFNFHGLYDRFVITRSDHYYKCNHDLRDLSSYYIWIPYGQDWHGICDRHIVCGAQHVYDVLNVLPPLILHLERYEKYSRASGFHTLSSTETFLKLRLKESGLLPLVRRCARVMFTCAVNGDNFLWSSPFKDEIPERVYVKYKQEYALAKFQCLEIARQKQTPVDSIPQSLNSTNWCAITCDCELSSRMGM
jgi:hypothetical protein